MNVYRTPAMLRPLAANQYDWRPERSPSGPITIVVSSADKAIYVYRNGNPIGRAVLEVKGRRLGEHLFTLLEGTTGKPSQLAPGRQAGRWMRVDGAGRDATGERPKKARTLPSLEAGEVCAHRRH
jgi:hypothetical protein